MSGPNGFKVVAPGLLTTVQDLGRPGFQSIGVTESGAVDSYALRLGNWLLLNTEDAAALEVSLLGPTLQALRTTAVCVTGADLGACLNDEPLPLWAAVKVVPGDRISFSGPRRGCRAYLCVAGGFDVPPVMGSRSTDLLGRLGGLDGRALRAGDLLPVGRPSRPTAALAGRRVPDPFVPDYPDELTARVVLGPQDDFFTPAGIQALLTGTYTISPQSNRMGSRLDGPAVEHSRGADIISDGMPLGGIQVPPSGQPIVLLQGRQTMGGYTKVATVISPDVGRIGQLCPGDRVRFTAVSVGDAHRIARAEWAHLDQARRTLLTLPDPGTAPAPVEPQPAAPAPGGQPTAAPVAPAAGVHQLRVRLAGREFAVTVEEA